MGDQEGRGPHPQHLPQSPFTGQVFQIATFGIAFYQSNLSTFGTLPKRMPSFAEVENNAKLIALEKPPNYHYVVLYGQLMKLEGGRMYTLYFICAFERFSGINLPSQNTEVYSFADRGVGGICSRHRNCRKKVSDGSRSLSIIHVRCRLCI